MAPYFNLVTSESIFKARSLSENPRSFSDLPQLASSKWGREHLFACRVVRREVQNNFLPIYSEHLVPRDTTFSPEIVEFLQGPNREHMGQSEHFLVHNYGFSLGQAWAALAAFKRPQNRRGAIPSAEREIKTASSSETGTESDTEELSRVKRVRRGTLQRDFVNSSGIQVGSSSPLTDRSYGTLDSSVGYVDGGSDGFLPLEDETVRLVSCVFRHILYFAPLQASGPVRAVVEFRDARMRLTASTPILERKMLAIDDGGLCVRVQTEGCFALKKKIGLQSKRPNDAFNL